MAEWTGLEPATPGVTGRCIKSRSMRPAGRNPIPKSANLTSNWRGLPRFNSKYSHPVFDANNVLIDVGSAASGSLAISFNRLANESGIAKPPPSYSHHHGAPTPAKQSDAQTHSDGAAHASCLRTRWFFDEPHLAIVHPISLSTVTGGLRPVAYKNSAALILMSG